jgi:predicted ATPase/DNA-binding SARP family transcriptional activator
VPVVVAVIGLPFLIGSAPRRRAPRATHTVRARGCARAVRRLRPVALAARRRSDDNAYAGATDGEDDTVVQIRLLGGVDATDDGGTIDVGPAKRRALLAALALSVGTAVPATRLVELVWGDDPPRTADKTLQAHVARLRAVLGRDAITRVGAAYRLDLPPDAVDVVRFQQRLDAGDVDGALDEWTGTPLAGLDADGLTAAVDRLVEQWLGATEQRLGRLVATDPATAVGPLTQLTATHPFREELWALLMTALYRVGRQADALAAYRSVRHLLDEQLGVEPGRRLRDLEAAILAHDDRLVPVPTAPDGGPAPVGDRRGNLAGRPPQLIGRDDDRTAVTDALATAAVVTLVGPGGIGKTQLALATAHTVAADWPDGVWLIELAPVGSAADVPRVVADTLGVIERPGRTITASIVAALYDRAALLVIDNCEHVLEATAEVVAAVVGGCPDVQVLATSRERLAVAREHVVVVPPLPPGPGAALFATRAEATAPTSVAATDAVVVDRICRRLDGVPLAIELAAARMSALTPHELLARLDDALRLLAGGLRDDVTHHQTLRATIRWSYDLLAPAERTVLQRLSVFAGPFDLHAVEHVATGGGLDAVDVAVLVGRLADQSMVLVESGPDGRWFRLLDTVRTFAFERLAETGHADLLADRHARWCADEVGRIGRLLAGPDELAGGARLTAVRPHLRTAIDHACAAGDHQLADALLRPIVGEIILRSDVEIGDWVERLLAIDPADDAETVAVHLGWAAQRYAVGHDPEGFDRLAARFGPPDHLLVRHARAFAHDDYPALAELGPLAVDELHRLGQHHLAELTEPDRGVALLNLGRLDEVDAHVGALVHRYRAQGPPTLLNWTLMLLGYAAAFRGDRVRAEHLFEAAVGVAVPPRTHSPNRAIQARIAWRRGQRSRAVALLRVHVDELLATGNMQGASLVAFELVTVLTGLGRLSDAARMLGYLQTTHLLDAPGFAALVTDPVAALTGDPTLDADIAEGRALDDRTALRLTRSLLATLG